MQFRELLLRDLVAVQMSSALGGLICLDLRLVIHALFGTSTGNAGFKVKRGASGGRKTFELREQLGDRKGLCQDWPIAKFRGNLSPISAGDEEEGDAVLHHLARK